MVKSLLSLIVSWGHLCCVVYCVGLRIHWSMLWLPSCLHIRICLRWKPSHADCGAPLDFVECRPRAQPWWESEGEDSEVPCPQSTGAGNAVLQYFRGKWIFKLERGAVKMAYIRWLDVHEERFDCLLLFSNRRCLKKQTNKKGTESN